MLFFTVNPGALIDFSNPNGAEFWKDQVKAKLLDYGAAVVWNDNNEYTLDDMEAYALNFEGMENNSKLKLGELGKTTHALLMARASYEAMCEHEITDCCAKSNNIRGNKFSFNYSRYSSNAGKFANTETTTENQFTRVSKRPAVITRSAGIGTHRFAVQTWSGDNFTGWQALRYNIPMAVSQCISGFPAGVGWDCGGFAGPSPTEELLSRWVQVSVFAPRFVIHSWKPNQPVTSMWMFGEESAGLKVMRAANEFRYNKLLAYLYQGTLEASILGYPMMRPLVQCFS